MKQRIWDAIDTGLLNAGDAARDVLQQVIYQNVYSYGASPWAMQKRRYADGGLGDTNNMIASVNGVGSAGRTHELQVENFAGLQDYGPNFRGASLGIGPSPAKGHYAARLDEIVETGNPSYRQPGPRPFYKDAEKQLVDGGVVTGEIAAALIAAGFEVIFTTSGTYKVDLSQTKAFTGWSGNGNYWTDL
jgi:hypothetical protein